jgi:hypothetical protein
VFTLQRQLFKKTERIVAQKVIHIKIAGIT